MACVAHPPIGTPTMIGKPSRFRNCRNCWPRCLAQYRKEKATPHLANEIDRSEVFAKLLHQGLVQDCGHDYYDCPIPSMRTYVEEFCAQRGCPIVPAVAEAVAPAAAAEASGGMDMEVG